MLSFLKKIFGSKPTEVSPAPYKVEAPATPVVTVTTDTKTEAVATKKPAAKKAVTAKPKAPRKPRAPKA